jgi:hypothetical protein
MRAIYIACVLLISLTADGFAQNEKARAKLSKEEIKIGEQVALDLSISNPNNKAVLFPNIADTIVSNVEVVKLFPPDTISDAQSGVQQLHQKVIITSFDSGFYALPPFRFIVDGDSSNLIETEAILLSVYTVPVDTTSSIKPIKAQMDTPFSLTEIWMELLAAFVLIVIAVLLIIYWKKNKKSEKTEEVQAEEIIPPHIKALQQLEQLEQQKLWQNGAVKEYHSAISEIIRSYIEAAFRMPAMEQTTDEIIKSLRSFNINTESSKNLNSLLRLADMVKYAKENPLAGENEISMSRAKAFVLESSKGFVDHQPEANENNPSENNQS